MDFGKTPSFADANFDIENHPYNKSFLVGEKSAGFKIFVGCPVWAHKSFIGKIYTEQVKSKDYLSHYKESFNSIELNTTFYAIPDVVKIQNWLDSVKKGFVFCPKFPKSISHHPLLGKNIDEIRSFIRSLDYFRERKHFGISFFQLPSNYSSDNVDNFLKFTSRFPKDLNIAFELRHQSWFAKKDLLLKVATHLHSIGKSLVISDVAGRRDVAHMIVTNNRAMIRFAGNSLHKTDYERLDRWREIILEWKKQGIEEIYFFFHQPKEGNCIELAKYFHKILSCDDISFPLPQLSGKRVPKQLELLSS